MLEVRAGFGVESLSVGAEGRSPEAGEPICLRAGGLEIRGLHSVTPGYSTSLFTSDQT